MSRRSDREGVQRSEFQRRRNAEVASRYRENERGWYIPEAVWEGFEALNAAIGWTRRALVLWSLLGPYEREFHLRHARSHLAEARTCARPRLPS